MNTCRAALFIVILSLALSMTTLGQDSPQAAAQVPVPEMRPETLAMRKQAMELFQKRMFSEAIPLFEKVLNEVPKDVVAQERLAHAVLEQADQATDPAQRKAGRIRARKEFLRAREIGDNSDLASSMLASLPEDGSDPQFSSHAGAQEWMQKGERAFSARNFPQAEQAYMEALKRDPKLYSAALFLGDVYMNSGEYDKAGQYFQKAIEIDPQKETAYRYWGDTLLKERKFASARLRFVDAVIAQPYTPHVWAGINNYLRAVDKPARFARITPPVRMTTNDKGGATVTLDSRPELQSAFWVAYPMARSLWQSQKFATEYPTEKQYRHSLKEEVEALTSVASVAETSLNSGTKLNEALAFLVEVNKAGMLEPYVLLNVPDQGIMQDYEQFRKEHRDLLVRYLTEIVLPPAPPDGK